MLNKMVTVYSGNSEYQAVAVDVLENGALVVDKNGERVVVSSGEVSVKL